MATLTTAAGSTVAYDVTGQGPALVLVHGITESSRSWDPLLADLAADHTVVTLDLPGHGQSGSAPAYDVEALAGAVAEVVTATGVDRPLLVGHSLGGIVVTAAAAAIPCRGVLNVDQPLDLAAFQASLGLLEDPLRGDEASFQGAIAAVFDMMAGAFDGDDRARIEDQRNARQDVVLAIWAPVLESDPADLEALVRAVGSGVTVPYLSLHGIDPGDGYADWLAGVIDGAAVEVWPDLGHYPHLVEPDRFLARLRAFDATLT